MRGRGLTARGRGLVAVLGLMALAISVLGSSCGGEGPSGGDSSTTGSPPTGGVSTTVSAPRVLTIEEALASSPREVIRVVGAVVATHPIDGGPPSVVLASAMAESYPPQAGGATIRVDDLDLDDLVGLTSTLGQTGTAQVTWSDHQVVLEGTVVDGTLRVRATPPVVETTADGLRVRFSPVSRPLVSGETEWWAFDVRNETQTAVELTFASGQKAEVILQRNGADEYRWSMGLNFTQAIETVILEPGRMFAVAINGLLDVPPGVYALEAFVTAVVPAIGGAVPPPALTGSVEVYGPGPTGR